jgi:hypothetical protein
MDEQRRTKRIRQVDRDGERSRGRHPRRQREIDDRDDADPTVVSCSATTSGRSARSPTAAPSRRRAGSARRNSTR